MKTKRILAIAVNLIMFVWQSVCMYHFFFRGGVGNMNNAGYKCFMYFTVDSNVIAGLAALVIAISKFISDRPKKFAVLFKFMGTVSVSITLLVVLTVLLPASSVQAMFGGDNLYMHLIGPLLAIISFGWLDMGAPVTRRQTYMGLIPVCIYGVWYVTMVLTGRMKDFYGLIKAAGGSIVAAAVAMLFAAWILSIIIKALHNDTEKL